MTPFISFLICGISVAAGAVIITRVRTALRLRAQKKQNARRRAIKPSVSFYFKPSESMNPDKNVICIKNTGQGEAVDIAIDDFYHPEEKDWHFTFDKTGQLDPGEEKAVDFDFLVGAYSASNKTDQMWMFDPDHDHDFATRIVLSYCDKDKNAYSRTITIGEDKKSKSSKAQRLQLIQTALSRRPS